MGPYDFQNNIWIAVPRAIDFNSFIPNDNLVNIVAKMITGLLKYLKVYFMIYIYTTLVQPM